VTSVPTPADTPTPLVSVITVCLNAEAHVRAAMESVLGQSYPAIEYLVVDGGSTDGTLDIVREFEPRFDGRLRWISEPDNGLYDAMNKGLGLATGELVGILNADDFYEFDAVARAVDVWRVAPDTGVLYGDLRTIDAEGTRTVLATPESVSAEQMRSSMTLHHPATFIATRVYAEQGTYDTGYRIAADYDFLLRCLDAGVRFTHVDGVLTNFSLEGVSNKAVRAADRESTHVRIAHGVNPVLAWGRFYKSALAHSVYGAFAHNAGFRRAYARYKGGA
jgi:glycosyltransferase involved in cell wall biosynthesis